MINENGWYAEIENVVVLEPIKRYQRLQQMHADAVADHMYHLRSMDEGRVETMVDDNWTRKQVVAHIMAWEEWSVQVLSDPKREVVLPRYMVLRGYFDPDSRETLDFSDPDHFNHYQSAKFKNWPWQDLKNRAMGTSVALKSRFPVKPKDGWIDWMDSTAGHIWKPTTELMLTLPSAWYLWMVSIEHLVVEHREHLRT